MSADKRISRHSFMEEEIEVKPSTELTPDEYEHFQEPVTNIEVHTFATNYESDVKNVEVFSDTLQKCGIEIKTENKHNLETDNCNEVFDNICTQSNNQAGLIILFSGTTRREGYLEMFDGAKKTDVNIEKIWSKFNSYNCKALKNKPKIFIFEVWSNRPRIQTDSRGRIHTTYELTYDTPAEADMLIIYNETNDIESEFMELLAEMIHDYGENEDIITLVTCIVSNTLRPILISTLTRKFYFTASDHRGHHSIIHKNQKELVANLKEVKETLGAKFQEKKGKRSVFGSFNFGKKNKDKCEQSPPKSEKAEPEPKPAANKTVPDSVPKTIPDSVPKAAPSTGRRPSVSTRTRTLSQSELEGGRTSRRVSERDKSKPIWKP